MELTSNDTISVYVTAVSGKLRSEPATTNVIREESKHVYLHAQILSMHVSSMFKHGRIFASTNYHILMYIYIRTYKYCAFGYTW